MILKDQFYTINALTTNENQVSAQVHIHPKHAIFSGHFPGNPVTPGVIQLEMIKEILSSGLGKPVKLQSISNCKFLAILNPNDHDALDVLITFTPTESGSLRINAQISTPEISFLKVSGEYAV